MNNIKEKSKYLLGGIILGIIINKGISIVKNNKKHEILLNDELNADEILEPPPLSSC